MLFVTVRQQVGASTAYFKITDEAGRLYYPGFESPPMSCTIFTVHEL